MFGDQHLPFFRLPSSSGNHGLFHSLRLDLTDFTDLFFHQLPFFHGSVCRIGVVFGIRFGKIVFDLAVLVFYHRLEIGTEYELKFARTEIEFPFPLLVQSAIRNHTIFQFRFFKPLFLGDGFHKGIGHFFKTFELHLLRDSVQLHQSRIRTDRF